MPLKRPYIAKIFRMLVLIGALSACEPYTSGHRLFSVDGATFSVPSEHLTSNDVPWLAATETSGFNFIVNPDSDADSRVFVTIEPRHALCGAGKDAVFALVRNLCSGQVPLSPKPGFVAVESRVYVDEYHDRWTYGPREAPFAVCFETGALHVPQEQQCYSIGIYKGIIYTMLYPDIQVGRISQIRKEIESLLDGWQVHE